MNSCSPFTDAAISCEFCGKPLPIIGGQVQRWRAASGLFFCNEFCADDAEEARFQSRGRSASPTTASGVKSTSARSTTKQGGAQ